MLEAQSPDVDLVQLVAASAAAAQLDLRWRTADSEGWQRLLTGLRYVPVTYSTPWIEYQLAYHREHAECIDLSAVILHDRTPCALWPLSLLNSGGARTLGSHGSPVLPPLFLESLPERSRKTVVQRCHEMMARLCLVAVGTRTQSVESFDGSTSGLSEWHVQSMLRGARASLRHEMYVDLSWPMAQIKACFRKSYRALVSAGMRTWRVLEMTGPDAKRWQQFRELHTHVAGRVTRSARTWDLQYQAICAGDAFLVYLLDQADAMVGGGFFYTTRDEGAYSVAAYDRALFDKPLGHVVQHRAIELLKERGARWYKIGVRPYTSEVPAPSPKEISIGDFKQGFATHFFPRYVLDHEFTSSNAS
ncbi:MAG: FemAB family protein [Pseudomonadota bacterium]